MKESESEDEIRLPRPMSKLMAENRPVKVK